MGCMYYIYSGWVRRVWGWAIYGTIITNCLQMCGHGVVSCANPTKDVDVSGQENDPFCLS